jgi:hypothetical protein
MTYGPLRRGHGQTYRDLILTHLVEYLQAKTTSFDVLMLVGGPFGDDAALMIRIVNRAECARCISSRRRRPNPIPTCTACRSFALPRAADEPFAIL